MYYVVDYVGYSGLMEATRRSSVDLITYLALRSISFSGVSYSFIRGEKPVLSSCGGFFSELYRFCIVVVGLASN